MRIEARRQVVREAQYGGTEGEGRLGAENANRLATVCLQVCLFGFHTV